MKYLRWLLLPFSLLYGLVVMLRNWCYDSGFFKSRRFGKPVISVGNLDVGGAGKSPMTEYLVRLLKDHNKLATLSRGYGRKTKGYLVGESRNKNQESRHEELSLSTQIGDEPAQFKNKFPDITVAVCEKRVDGIEKLLRGHDLIILDDAYQHRAVEPGLSILLFDYNRLNDAHLLLPAGNLREPFSGRWRAQVLVVSKCPSLLSEGQKTDTFQRLSPLPDQSLFFSSILYQPLVWLDGGSADVVIDRETTVFLLTGIANAKPLLQYLEGFGAQIIHHNYPDHHQFTLKNIAKLAEGFTACTKQKRIIVTTEKDAQRLHSSWFKTVLPGTGKPPVFVLPIKVEFLDDSGQQFDRLITTYVREHTAHNSIH